MASAFDSSHWNLLQTLAWIYLGDRWLVERCADEVVDHGSHWAEVQGPDGTKELVEIPAAAETLLSLYVAGGVSQATAVDSVDVARALLIRTLADGRITALGIANKQGDFQEIPAHAWVGVKIYDDPVHVAPKDFLRPGATLWYDVKVPRDQVLAIWPDPLAQALARSTSRRTLLTFAQVADRWLHEQSGTGLNAAGLAADLVKLAEESAFAFRPASDEPTGRNFDPRLGLVIETASCHGSWESPEDISAWVRKASEARGDITAKRLIAANDLSVTLHGLRRWLDGSEGAAAWCQTRGLSRPKFVDRALSEIESPRLEKQTIAARTRAHAWLTERLNGPVDTTKAKIREEVRSLFSLSIRGFNETWDRVIEETGRSEWSKPGRKSSR